jgi:hypothetical protein
MVIDMNFINAHEKRAAIKFWADSLSANAHNTSPDLLLEKAERIVEILKEELEKFPMLKRA